MNFDYGNVITRALQYSWKHKSFWGLLALPMLPSFLMLPLMFGLLFLMDSEPTETIAIVSEIVLFIIILLCMAASLIMFVICSSAVTLGIIRADREEGSLKFMDLFRDSLAYFWRELGVIASIQFTVGLIFSAFFGCVAIGTFVTMGLASICVVPIQILIVPAVFLTLAVMEAAQTAVIAEDVGVIDALERALEIVREHFWKYVLITVIIYFGSSILSSFIVIPSIIPLFFFPVLMDPGGNLNTQYLPVLMGLFFCVFFPVMTLVSVVTQTIMKAMLDLTYLRLVQINQNRVISFGENPK